MARLGDLYRRGVDVPVRWKGESFTVRYNPADVTNQLLNEMQEQAEDGAAFNDVVASLERILVGWDVTDDDDKPVKLDRALMDAMPLEVLVAINRAVIADVTDPNNERRSRRG